MNTKTAMLFLLLAALSNAPALRSQTLQQNRPPAIESLTPSDFTFSLCPFFPDSYMLQLTVTARDPDSDSLTYRYFASAGRILGKGAQVNWDLRKALGRQQVRVEVRDRRGAKAYGAIRINVVPHTACDSPRPPCPLLRVSSSPRVFEGHVVNFIADIRVPGHERELKYRWSQTNGKIMSGQGTRRLRVKATGVSGTEILATVNVGGLDPACNREASGKSRIKSRE